MSFACIIYKQIVIKNNIVLQRLNLKSWKKNNNFEDHLNHCYFENSNGRGGEGQLTLV